MGVHPSEHVSIHTYSILRCLRRDTQTETDSGRVRTLIAAVIREAGRINLYRLVVIIHISTFNLNHMSMDLYLHSLLGQHTVQHSQVIGSFPSCSEPQSAQRSKFDALSAISQTPAGTCPSRLLYSKPSPAIEQREVSRLENDGRYLRAVDQKESSNLLKAVNSSISLGTTPLS